MWDLVPRRFILFAPERLILSVIFCEATVKSLAFQFVHKTQQSQAQRWFWIVIYVLWMKLILVLFERFSFEMESLFFCLIKRTKNQGCVIVVKAQISIWCEISLRGALFCSLLKGYRQKSSISVRSQNPTISRPVVILN